MRKRLTKEQKAKAQSRRFKKWYRSKGREHLKNKRQRASQPSLKSGDIETRWEA